MEGIEDQGGSRHCMILNGKQLYGIQGGEGCSFPPPPLLPSSAAELIPTYDDICLGNLASSWTLPFTSYCHPIQ
jgi:hypothetical protein